MSRHLNYFDVFQPSLSQGWNTQNLLNWESTDLFVPEQMASSN